MRNAVALCVSQNRRYHIQGQFKLLRDFGNAHTIVEVIDDCVHRHPRPSQYRRTTLHPQLNFNQQTPRPVDFVPLCQCSLSNSMIPYSRAIRAIQSPQYHLFFFKIIQIDPLNPVTDYWRNPDSKL